MNEVHFLLQDCGSRFPSWPRGPLSIHTGYRHIAASVAAPQRVSRVLSRDGTFRFAINGSSRSGEGPDSTRKPSFNPGVAKFYMRQFWVVCRESYICGKVSVARTSISYGLKCRALAVSVGRARISREATVGYPTEASYSGLYNLRLLRISRVSISQTMTGWFIVTSGQAFRFWFVAKKDLKIVQSGERTNTEGKPVSNTNTSIDLR